MAQKTLPLTAAEDRDLYFSTLSLLREAIDYCAESFEGDEEVDGAALVEWFSGWRWRVTQTLELIQAKAERASSDDN